MPFDNLGRKHFDEAQIAAIDEALQVILDSIADMSENLSPKERSKYGKVGDQKELLIDKVRDYNQNQPENCAPEVDWNEFHLDYKDRKTVWEMLSKIRSIEYQLMNIKILADRDNYKAALSDYQYAQYRGKFGAGAGFSTKIDQIKVFFPKTGKTSNKKGKKED